MCIACSNEQYRRDAFGDPAPERPTLNRDLIKDLLFWAACDEREIADMVERFKGWGNWDQGHWGKELRNGACQTAFCMAGQAVVQMGYGLEYEFDSNEYDGSGTHSHRVFTASTCAPQVVVGTDKKGRPVTELLTSHSESIEVVGARVLGLTTDEAGEFFSGSNWIGRLVELANHFAERRGLGPFVDEQELYDEANRVAAERQNQARRDADAFVDLVMGRR